MARFEVEGPDGHRYEVEAPDEAGAISGLQAHLGASAPAPAPPAASGVLGQAVDAAKGLGTGIQKFVVGAPGLPADIGQAAQYAVDWGKSKVQGRPLEDVQAETRANAVIAPETLAKYGSQAFTQGYERHAGPDAFYKPQGFAGRAGEAVGNFAIPALMGGAGGPLMRLGMGAAVPGVASETVSTLTGSPELGTAAAVVSPFAASRLVTPIRSIGGPARAANVATLDAEGVPLTAGQRTGNRRLQWAESITGDSIGAGGAATNAVEAGNAGFNRAAIRRMGEDADQITPELFQNARQRLGDEYRTLTDRYNISTQGLGNRITAVMQRHLPDMTPENQNRFINIIQDRLAANVDPQGYLPGRRYQALRSSLTEIAQGGNDRPFQLAVRGLRNALDDSMAATVRAGGVAEDIGRWETAGRQWGAMRSLEDATQQAATRDVSPAALRRAIAARNPVAQATGQSELGNLARAGADVMAPLPNSGTSPREAVRAVMMGLGAAAGNQIAGLEGGMLGALGPIAGPAVAGRVVMSRPAQAYLGNTIFPYETDTRLAALLRALGRARSAAGQEVESP